MEPLSSQREIICLIKDFPSSQPPGQSEVFAPGREWSDQKGTLGLQGRTTVDCPASIQRRMEDQFNPAEESVTLIPRVSAAPRTEIEFI